LNGFYWRRDWIKLEKTIFSVQRLKSAVAVSHPLE